ncbi:MAG TPA: flap endonuclease-1 [Thermoproteota archaeon]|nr:flap endonuclease-1 [Thermoproteota archaeon]
MGVDIGDILTREEITFDRLRSKVVAIDGYNILYQFLSIIRGADGRPLTDNSGRTTSHLSGLFYRVCNLLSNDIWPVFVLDGEPPRFKRQEVEERKERKKQAQEKYDRALRAGDLEGARKYAQATARVNEYIRESSKQLLGLMGIPCIQAPSEGEAQAAHLAREGMVFAAASQDYDSALFGAPKLVRNLGVTGRRKLPGRRAYVEVKPEIVDIERTVQDLGITRSQLIDIAILVGTDYCDGIKGLGSKKALALVARGAKLQDIYRERDVVVPENLDQIVAFFMNPPVAEVRSLDFQPIDKNGVVSLLVGEYSFSEERVMKTLEGTIQRIEAKKSGLARFIQG